MQPLVERQGDGLVAPFQPVVEAALDTREAIAVGVAVADHMREQIALGVDPPPLGHELEAGQPQIVHQRLFPRSQVALHPHEALARRQPLLKLSGIDVRQHGGEFSGSVLGIEHLLGIGEQRRRLECRRQQHAVAVDDVATGMRYGRGGLVLGKPHVGAFDRDLNQAHRDCREGHAEHRRGDEKPRMARIKSAARRPLGRCCRAAGIGLEVARATRVLSSRGVRSLILRGSS